MRRDSLFFSAVLVVIGLSAGTVPAAQTPAATQATTPRLVEMRHHYADVTLLHEAVIRGDLKSSVEPARRLANLATPAGVPETATPYLEAIRAAGRRAMIAGSVGEVATATATMLEQCGACHQSQGIRPMPGSYARPDVGSTVGHMLEHQSAADQLLLGLVLPSQTEWRQGMERLRVAPLKKADLPMSGQLAEQLLKQEKAVHELATRAATDATSTRRVNDYAEVLSTCANCHSLHARIWGPGTGK